MARKRKKSRLFLYFSLFLGIGLLTVFAFFLINYFYVAPNIFYPGFEISIPSGYEIHGIDVSRYQDKINWQEVKEMESRGVKIGFVFIKATEGASRIDNSFERNWRGASQQNITKGAYHFFYPGRDPYTQAENFIQQVNLKPGDPPPVLDIEKTGMLSVNQVRQSAQILLDKMEQHYGVVPIIYTNISFYEKYFGTGFEKYPIWIAHYLQPDKPRTQRKWAFWQHSEAGRVNGIRHKVDFNVFSGDSTAFKKLLIPAPSYR